MRGESRRERHYRIANLCWHGLRISNRLRKYVYSAILEVSPHLIDDYFLVLPYLAIMNVVKPQAHDIVLIFGCGVVGLTAVMAAALTSCTIIAVDNVESKCELALSLGATHKINPTTHDVVDEVRKLTGGKMATWALDCVGNLKVLQTGHDSLVSYHHPENWPNI